MTEHDIIPDGITDIAGGEIDDDVLMLSPSDLGPEEFMIDDSRNITVRKRNIVVAAKTKIRIIDNHESGSLNYVMIKVSRRLPTDSSNFDQSSGTEGTDPSKLALFLQLDGYAQGGFESIYDPALKTSVAGVTLQTISELNLPEQFGMWFLTVDDTDNMVAVYRGKNEYNHRIRFEVFNTDTSGSLNVEFVEIARARSTNKEGKSNQIRGLPFDKMGY